MARINASALFCLAMLFMLISCASEPKPQSASPAQLPAIVPQDLPGWVAQIERQASGEGVSQDTLHAAFDAFVPNPRVAQLDQKQPEGTISFAAYRHNIVAASRIAKGAALKRQYEDSLHAIAARTGVPPQIVVALWGIESNFGQNMGGFETVNSLATLAYEGRRAAFFRGELMAALHIVDQQHINVADLRGSWAGAMGQCQFMPTTYLKYAVDGDGDGRVDIWNDTADTLASIGHYLAAEGWQAGQDWGREVSLTQPVDPAELGLDRTRTLQQWTQYGVMQVNGQPLPASEQAASLLQPDGPGTPAFLVYDNIRAFMRWNHSTYFALSVGLLADGISAK